MEAFFVGKAGGAPKKRYHCTVERCQYSTPYAKDLARHMRKHTGKEYRLNKLRLNWLVMLLFTLQERSRTSVRSVPNHSADMTS